ncbi:hypothetical protein [Chondromyces crocatus]|uniref:Uncharacterized protein n=1 Tax=Chondromyces crocatus TaxID=52 RepID=A0A0K1ESH2_CHOCO|nr:hypothetical protein [Chondromyces crocatus]AKT43749.1 uncharacterized protein CMC5_079850 [Chondromyces crocatus]
MTGQTRFAAKTAAGHLKAIATVHAAGHDIKLGSARNLLAAAHPEKHPRIETAGARAKMRTHARDAARPPAPCALP